MDLMALRYVDYAKSFLLRNGTRDHQTQTYKNFLLKGTKIAGFDIDPVIHLWDLDGESKHLFKIYDFFWRANVDFFADENVQIKETERHSAG